MSPVEWEQQTLEKCGDDAEERGTGSEDSGLTEENERPKNSPGQMYWERR